MRKILLSILPIFLLTSLGFAQEKDKILTDEVKKTIIKKILLSAKLSNRYLEYGEKKEEIWLLSENINSGLLPPIPGIKYIFISGKELETKKKTDFTYYYFGSFKMSGKKITVSFGRNTFTSGMFGGNGECSTFTFKWVKGKWEWIDFVDNRWVS